MKKLLFLVSTTIALMMPSMVNAQVFSQNQIIIPPFGSGVIISTSTANGGKLQASSSPSLGSIYATSTTATSSLQNTSVNQLKIGSLSGILKAIGGFITTALVNLTSDVTGILPVANGGTGLGSLSPGQLLYGSGTSAVSSVATTTLIAGTNISFSGGVPVIVGASPITINASGGGGSGVGTISTSTPEVSGQIPFFTSTAAYPALQGGDTNLVWDNTNKRLGVGSSTPQHSLVVSGRSYFGSDGLPAASQGTVLNSYTTDLNTNIVLNAFQAVGTINAAGSIQTLQFLASDTGGNNVSTIQGINGIAQKTTGGLVGGLTAVNASPRLTTTARATAVVGFNSQIRAPAGTGATTTTDFLAAAATSGGTVDAAYGFRTVAKKVSGVAIGYGFASDGATDLNYFVGNTGVGTTSPYAQLSIGGNVVVGASTAGGTLGDLFLPKLATAAGAPLAVDPTGKVIATTSPVTVVPGGLNLQVQYNNGGIFGGISGATTNGTIINLTNPLIGGATLTTSSVNGVTLTTGGSATSYLNGTGAYSVPVGTTYTSTYPITLAGTVFSLAFGTTTSNTWAGTQTFTNSPVFSTLAAGTVNSTSGGAIYNTATTSLSVGSPLTVTGTFGALIGGTNSTINCQTASGSQAGCLSSADWTTFNGKQAAGSYITALTGDLTASGPGSVAATLATVNSNIGTFNTLTVNGKGLVTAASNTSYQAPISLTTTGSGAATFVSNVLNIPTPAAGYSPVGTTGQLLSFSSTNTLSATSTLTLLTNGNFGIGTSSPYAQISQVATSTTLTPWALWTAGFTASTTNYTVNGTYVKTVGAVLVKVSAVGGGGGGYSFGSGFGGGGGGSSALGNGTLVCAPGGGAGGTNSGDFSYPGTSVGGGAGNQGNNSNPIYGAGAALAVRTFATSSAATTVMSVFVGQGGVQGGAGGTGLFSGGAGGNNGSNINAGAGGAGCTAAGSSNAAGGAGGAGSAGTITSGQANQGQGSVLSGDGTSAGGGGAGGQAGYVKITEYIFSASSPFFIGAAPVNGGQGGIGWSVGSSSPMATLTVSTPAEGLAAFAIAQAINAVNYVTFQIDKYAHEVTGGKAPIVGTCASVTGDDTNMRVITGDAQSSCTVNFANTYTVTPICIANEESAGTVSTDASSTPTSVTLSFATGLTSKSIAVHCEASNNFTY